MTKVNLIYSNTSLPFFNTLNVMTVELQRQKTDTVQINDKDENEIGRGNSYAFFDELKNKAITTTLFRQSLIDRGITDLNFQNRIFNLILQNRDGIQFGVCRVLETLIIGNNFKIFHPQGMDNDIQLHAIDEQHVELVFKRTYSDMSNVEQENPAFDIEMRFVISTDRVDITTFEFTKTSDTAETENFFNFLNEHQANFLMKFIIMIKQWLGMDVGIRLEDTQTSRPSSSK